MSVALPEQCATSIPTEAGSLFVATSLYVWFTGEPDRFARDFQVNDTVYRRLDPEYYAWLRSRMVVANEAAAAGHFNAAAFEDLRVRFNAVHGWAVEHFGADELLTAVQTVRAGAYKPPVAEDEETRVPVPGVRRSTADEISPEATALVDSISEQALSLGWKRQRLYAAGSSSMFDAQRGLVCFLKAGDRIGEVTLQSIEIIGSPPQEVHHRFYNPDEDQPWILNSMQKSR